MKKEDKLQEDVKLKIAISSFYEEERKNMKTTKKNVLKIASVACLIILLITGGVMAKDIGNFIQKLFGANTSDGVDIAINNGYVAEVKSENYSSEGIGISVKSIIMDDFNFAINFDMTLDDRYNIEEFERIELHDLKVVDETGEIVFNAMGFQFETEDEMREKGYGGAYSFLPTKTGERSYKISLSATGNPKLFPKSKMLNISFTKIKTWKFEGEDMIEKFYQGNWEFEIQVPEEFYKREAVIYQAKSCNEEQIDIHKISAVLSNTGFRLTIPSIRTN